MAKKKRTGLLVATGCGLLLCIPLCLGVVGGLGGGLWVYATVDDPMAGFNEAAMMDDARHGSGSQEFDALVDQDKPGAVDDEATDSGLEPGAMDADFDSGLFDVEEGEEPDVGEARLILEDNGVPTVTNTRRQPKPTPNDDERDVMDALDDMDDIEFDDEEDFDDIAAEIAALDSLDDLDDEPTKKKKKKSPPSDKPGTIKVNGDYDRASVIGSDGVYRSPGKFDPGTYRLEITLDDGTVVTKTVKLKGGQTIKFKCDVDAGDCSR